MSSHAHHAIPQSLGQYVVILQIWNVRQYIQSQQEPFTFFCYICIHHLAPNNFVQHTFIILYDIATNWDTDIIPSPRYLMMHWYPLCRSLGTNKFLPFSSMASSSAVRNLLARTHTQEKYPFNWLNTPLIELNTPLIGLNTPLIELNTHLIELNTPLIKLNTP